MLSLPVLVSGLLVPAVLAGGNMRMSEPKGVTPGPPPPLSPTPEEYYWDLEHPSFTAMLESLTFAPFDEFSESKQPVKLAKDLFANIVKPEVHELIDPAVVCIGEVDDVVVCSQSIPRGGSKLEARIDRKGCKQCIFYGGDCSRCPFLDGTTESCSSPETDNDSSDMDCPKK